MAGNNNMQLIRRRNMSVKSLQVCRRTSMCGSVGLQFLLFYRLLTGNYSETLITLSTFLDMSLQQNVKSRFLNFEKKRKIGLLIPEHWPVKCNGWTCVSQSNMCINILHETDKINKSWISSTNTSVQKHRAKYFIHSRSLVFRSLSRFGGYGERWSTSL